MALWMMDSFKILCNPSDEYFNTPYYMICSDFSDARPSQYGVVDKLQRIEKTDKGVEHRIFMDDQRDARGYISNR